MEEFVKEVEAKCHLYEGAIKSKSRYFPLTDIRISMVMCLKKSYYSLDRASDMINRDRTSGYYYQRRFNNIERDPQLKEIYSIIRNIYIKLN